ncbi:hypothetical protein KP509_22G023900 [Ceratopteris richardii]|nr:hypothetical protein KP509_22G023900 [Ceratopteris richardii]
MEGSILDELLKGTHACTHTHTCNPPGPSNAPHTHTCVHMHTHLFSQQQQHASSDTLGSSQSFLGAEEQNPDTPDAAVDASKKRPIGNREAVKKYREKKKAHTAYLEDQVAQLQSVNQQLLRRLQGHAALEAEVIRLRTLLAEFRGRIDGELGIPYGGTPRVLHPLPGGYMMNSYSVPCSGADVPCLHPSLERDNGSATFHGTSASMPPYPCEKASAKCATKKVARKKQAENGNSVVILDGCRRKDDESR